jgi:hypothetical protein
MWNEVLHTCLSSGKFFKNKMIFKIMHGLFAKILDFLNHWIKLVNMVILCDVVLKTMYYIPNALYHIHPIYSLGYLNVWIGFLEDEGFYWLRAPGGQSARMLRAQPAELADFLCPTCLLVVPLSHVRG